MTLDQFTLHGTKFVLSTDRPDRAAGRVPWPLARAVLQARIREPVGRRALVLALRLSAGATKIDDDELLRRSRHALEQGAISLEIADCGVRIPPLEAVTSPHHEPTIRGPLRVPVHWIEIVLVDEAGQPVPGEPYEIEMPDGRIRRGRLDDNGSARVDGIEQSGACKVTFPSLDQDAWSGP